MSPLQIMKSFIATVTTRARSGPPPMVCVQVIERAPAVAAEELELSNVIAADAGRAAQNSSRRSNNPAASGLSALTRRTFLLRALVFMMDSFFPTRNQGLLSASGKFRSNEAAKSANFSADGRLFPREMRRKLLIAATQ